MNIDLSLALIAKSGPVIKSVDHQTPRGHCEERSDEATF